VRFFFGKDFKLRPGAFSLYIFIFIIIIEEKDAQVAQTRVDQGKRPE
jgi:hypothetical protein